MDITVLLGTILLVLFTCIFIYSTWNSMYRKCNLPPGPTPCPLIGNLLSIKKGELVNSLMKLWKQYGPVYTLYFGSQPVIILCGYEAVKEALVDQAEEFGDRGTISSIDRIAQGYGISFSNGERWKQIRNFTLKNLRDLGLGRKSVEEKIQEEAQCLVEELLKSNETPVDPTKMIMDAVSNILCSILFGDCMEYSEERFSKLIAILEDMSHIISGPWCQGKENPDSEFSMRNCLMTMYSLILGGIETVSTTVRHGILLMVKYPHIQARIHEEIDRVFGRQRALNRSDRIKMPYTEAVINEIQRFSDIAPLSVPHKVTKDTHFRGFTIPKDTQVFPLLCTVHRDPKYFSTPYKFNPDHFLDEQGRFKKNDAMMAFSAGKRSCPGESLARMELFLFFTSILQNFTLASPTHFTEDDVAPKLTGFMNIPINYKVLFVARQ
ncbi:cytochrome P450 2G1-like [Rhinophrynus dorsalis]